MSSSAGGHLEGAVVGLHVWPEGDPTPLAVDRLELDWGGPIGDRHYGETMLSNGRQQVVFPRGTQIRNHRQVSLVDEAELALIAAALGVADLAPGLLADNICTRGLDELTALPRMTRLVFDGGVVLMTGGENHPCAIAGALVGAVHGTDPAQFTRAAKGRRGVTAWVERPGIITPGEGVRALAP